MPLSWSWMVVLGCTEKRSFISLCVYALLVAEATQAITPDLTSLVSARLFHIVRAVAEFADSGRTLSDLISPEIPPRDRPLTNGSVPREDNRSDHSDEVCLASFQGTPSVAGKHAHDDDVRLVGFTFNPDEFLRQTPGPRSLTRLATAVPARLIHTLCRMNC